MTKEFRKRLDIVPLIILFISAGYTLGVYFAGNVLLRWQHFLGLTLIFISSILFFRNHKLGVLSLGLIIILGLVGIVQLTPGITMTTIGKTIDGGSITLLKFQPIFVLWAIIHFVLSGRYYIGISSSKYWDSIKSDEPFRIE